MAMASKEVSLLFHLISIPSISVHEGKACSYLASQLPSLGWDDTYIDEAGNVVASRGDGKNEIVLLGHIDTVKAVLRLRWMTTSYGDAERLMPKAHCAPWPLLEVGQSLTRGLN